MGCSYEFIQILNDSNIFICNLIICEKKRRNPKIVQYAERHNIPYFEINTKQELVEVVLAHQQLVHLFLIYEMGVIIPVSQLSKLKIFNFHPGNLKSNRGAHPIIWSILKQEKETKMSFYQIGDEIDLGLLISEKTVKILNRDTATTLKEKLEATIPCILRDFELFQKGEIIGRQVNSGVYRRKIVSNDYIIDLEKDNCAIIDAKIRSQSSYKGAILQIGGENHYIKTIKELDEQIVNKYI